MAELKDLLVNGQSHLIGDAIYKTHATTVSDDRIASTLYVKNAIKDASSAYKKVQSTVSDPTASGTASSFIATITQNAQGVISVTKKNLPANIAYSSGSTASFTDKQIIIGASGSSITVSGVTITTSSPNSQSNDTTVPTSKAVNDALNGALTKVLTYKGTVGTGGDVSVLPTDTSVGWVYVVCSSGNFAGKDCEPGDYIICNTTSTQAGNTAWDVITGENQVENKSATLASASKTVTIATVDGTNITITTPSTWTGVDKVGTITSVKMNNTTTSSGAVDLGTVLTTVATTGSGNGNAVTAVYSSSNKIYVAKDSSFASYTHNHDGIYAPDDHTHGNISNDGTITTSTSIASGDRLIIRDSDGKIISSSLTFGTGTTTFLRNDGTWGTPNNTDEKQKVTSTTGTVYLSGVSTTSATAQVGYANASVYMSNGKLFADSIDVQNASISTAKITNLQATTSTLTNVNITTATISTINGVTVGNSPKFTDTVYTHPSKTVTVTTSSATLVHGGSFLAVNTVSYDASGHISSINVSTLTLPGSGNTDFKVYTTLSNETIYLSGATTTAAATASQKINASVYMNNGVLNAFGINATNLTVSGTATVSALKATTINGVTVGNSPKFTDTVYTHPASSGTDTTSSITPAHGGTFSVIDSITRDSSGHISKINTKTVTLPASGNTDERVKQTSTSSDIWRPILASQVENPNGTATASIYNTSIGINPGKKAVKIFGCQMVYNETTKSLNFEF